jgi:hypothetical protein
MARYLTHPSARSLLGGAFIAGIVGALLFDAFLFVVRAASFPSTYQWIAAGIVGTRRAFEGTDYVPLGIALHFAIAILAALAYAYVGQIVGVLGRPLLGGIVFGLLMNGVMDLVVYLKELGPMPHGAYDVGIGLIAHVIFYGLPVAFYIARFERVPVPYS